MIFLVNSFGMSFTVVKDEDVVKEFNIYIIYMYKYTYICIYHYNGKLSVRIIIIIATLRSHTNLEILKTTLNNYDSRSALPLQ